MSKQQEIVTIKANAAVEISAGIHACDTKLDTALEAQDIRGAHLVGADYSPDLWYPYLWMQGGEILERINARLSVQS